MEERLIQILCVGSSDDDCRFMMDCLGRGEERFGITAIFDRTSFDACLSSQDEFDVILTNISAFEFDELEIIDVLRCKFPGIPIVAVVDIDSEELAVGAVRKDKIDDYVIRGSRRIECLPEIIRHVFDVRNICRRFSNKETGLWLILSNVAEGILVVDAKGHILFANSSASRLLGKPVEELVGVSFSYP